MGLVPDRKVLDRLGQNKLVVNRLGVNTLELNRQVDNKLVLGKLAHKCHALLQVSVSCSSYAL
jgi:hypothetical protein